MKFYKIKLILCIFLTCFSFQNNIAINFDNIADNAINSFVSVSMMYLAYKFWSSLENKNNKESNEFDLKNKKYNFQFIAQYAEKFSKKLDQSSIIIIKTETINLASDVLIEYFKLNNTKLINIKELNCNLLYNKFAGDSEKLLKYKLDDANNEKDYLIIKNFDSFCRNNQNNIIEINTRENHNLYSILLKELKDYINNNKRKNKIIIISEDVNKVLNSFELNNIDFFELKLNENDILDIFVKNQEKIKNFLEYKNFIRTEIDNDAAFKKFIKQNIFENDTIKSKICNFDVNDVESLIKNITSMHEIKRKFFEITNEKLKNVPFYVYKDLGKQNNYSSKVIFNNYDKQIVSSVKFSLIEKQLPFKLENALKEKYILCDNLQKVFKYIKQISFFKYFIFKYFEKNKYNSIEKKNIKNYVESLVFKPSGLKIGGN